MPTPNTGDAKVFVPSSAARSEKGYTIAATPQQWWTDLAGEETPELRWPNSVGVFERMASTDTQVESALAAITSPILRTTWAIDGLGCDPAVVAHVANDLGLPVLPDKVEGDTILDRFARMDDVAANRTRGRFSWTEHLETAVVDHLVYGHAIFEQIYYPIVPAETGGDGLFHLRKLGYRPARTIAAFNVAADGGLISITQKSPEYGGAAVIGFGANNGPELKVDRLVAYVHRKRGGNWQGRSALRSAYKNWLLKDRELRVQDQVIERNGLGIPTYTAPDGSAAQLQAGLDITSALRAGDNSGVAVPKDAKLEILGVTGTLPQILPVIRYHDESILKSVLANVLNLGQSAGTGSWALGTTLEQVKNLAVEVVAENIRDTATKHIIEDLVDINYGPTEPSPRLVFAPITAAPVNYGADSVAATAPPTV
jgi:hypothetical protein